MLSRDNNTMGAHCYECKARFRIPKSPTAPLRCPTCGSRNVIDHNLGERADAPMKLQCHEQTSGDQETCLRCDGEIPAGNLFYAFTLRGLDDGEPNNCCASCFERLAAEIGIPPN